MTTTDTRTEAERRYDETRLSRTPTDKPAPLGVLEGCPDCTEQKDCPACTARLEAEHQRVRARAAAADSATERAEILLEGCEAVDGDLIFDVLLEDRAASYVWYRCIDWVLWRQANGLPVKRCGTDDTVPAAINARYNAARDLWKRPHTWHTENIDGGELSMGNMIADWERTPAEEAELAQEMAILEKLIPLLEAAGL
jgi:hypothetical protein